MLLFLLFTVKTEKSQNAKLNFLRQTSFYNAKYLIFGIKNSNTATCTMHTPGTFNVQSAMKAVHTIKKMG